MTSATRDALSPDSQTDSNHYAVLAATGCVSLALLLLGGWLTYLGLGPWYYRLDFPPYQPPGWLFTPMWTIVLFLLAWATWKVARQEACRRGVGLALAIYGAQCVLNVGWSLLFFSLQRPDAALWELLVLDVTLLAMIVAYARISRAAGLLLVPYLAWLLFATAINAWIVHFNAPFTHSATMPTLSSDHHVHMQKAIELARQNPRAPFGSVLVDRRTNKVVASGVNQSAANPILHGEIAAISDYARQGKADWDHLTLYTTAEPCCMCQGAIIWSGIEQVVFGSSIAQLKTLGWQQIDIPAPEVVSRSWKRDLEIVGGICEDECHRLFADALR